MKIKSLLFACFVPIFFACNKFLDKKPSASLTTISTLDDLQHLLDYCDVLNNSYPSGEEIFTDNFYLNDEDWAALSQEYERNFYLWIKDDNTQTNWQAPYSAIYYCNLVLESLPEIKVKESEKNTANAIEGAACFLRAFYFYGLSQFYCENYDITKASNQLGIPLKLKTVNTEKIYRSTLQKTYEQIINDYKRALLLLPENQSYKTRPSRAAGYGALARTYLAMGDYQDASLYADSCLSLYDELIDYNELDASSDYPIERFNKEVIFHAISVSAAPLRPTICRIDSLLHDSYNDNDLRKQVLFYDNGDGSFSFKADYDGGTDNYGHVFSGIVTDEIFLIKAECEARLGNTITARGFLNELLQKRYDTINFQPVMETNPENLLNLILKERRKELLFRGTRLTDLKRLNQETKYAVTIKRYTNGINYKLNPGDSRYVAQIPERVIELDDIEQNP